MLNANQKSQLFLIFGCIKKEISKKNWSYESQTHKVDSLMENPFLTLKSGEQIVEKIMDFLHETSKFRSYIKISHDKNLIYIHWRETTDALLYLDTYKVTPSSSTENGAKPTPPNPVPPRTDEPSDILSTFKALVKRCGGLNGVHFDRIELQINRKDSKFPVITFRNNGKSQSERTQLFLIELGLEPLVLNNQTPNVVSFKLPDTADGFNVEDITKLKESFPNRKVLESEQRKSEGSPATQGSTTLPDSPAPSVSSEPVSTPHTKQGNPALVEAIGVMYSSLSKEDQNLFIEKHIISSLTDSIRNNERERLTKIICNFLAKDYAIVKTKDAVVIEKDPTTGTIGFSIKSIEPSILLG